MQKFTLVRFGQDDKATLGKIINDQEQILCYTLELAWNNNFRGKSCIPEGIYKCKPHNGTKYQDVWEITGVVGRSAILIHNGNFIENTDGCVLVGRNHTTYMVNDSMNTLKKLRTILPQEFLLEVKCEGFSNNLCKDDQSFGR